MLPDSLFDFLASIPVVLAALPCGWSGHGHGDSRD
jgi:hypothetical protein